MTSTEHLTISNLFAKLLKQSEMNNIELTRFLNATKQSMESPIMKQARRSPPVSNVSWSRK
jgi:hypothetical protein